MIFFMVFIIVFGCLVARPDRQSTILLGAVGVCTLTAAVLFTTAFADMFAAMVARLERADSVSDRSFGTVLAFLDPLMTAPVLGHGIGAGTPAISRFLNLQPLIYGEVDLERNINELGVVLGSTFLALRFAFAGFLVWIALQAARQGVLMALPIAGFACLQIAVGQITHSPLSGFQPWLFAGLVIAIYETLQPPNYMESEG
jgi:hypothetical protein